MTKVKLPPEHRIYDVDGYWLRAACICVKDHSESEVSPIVCVKSFIEPGFEMWVKIVTRMKT